MIEENYLFGTQPALLAYGVPKLQASYITWDIPVSVTQNSERVGVMMGRT
jgi:hypothetical protein